MSAEVTVDTGHRRSLFGHPERSPVAPEDARSAVSNAPASELAGR
jgi:hypothetical protein